MATSSYFISAVCNNDERALEIFCSTVATINLTT
jgi:hypothetical protein